MQIVQFGFSPVVDVPLLMQADKTWKEPWRNTITWDL